VECNRPPAPVLQCSLARHDFRIWWIRNCGALETVEKLAITSLEGEASRPGGA
jgi:hypothetical protein